MQDFIENLEIKCQFYTNLCSDIFLFLDYTKFNVVYKV